MPSCQSSHAVRVKPWLAHTPQPDDPPPGEPGEPDAPPIGDPPPQPGEVPRSEPPRAPAHFHQSEFTRRAGLPRRAMFAATTAARS